MVAVEQQAAIAQDALREIDRGAIQDHEVDWTPQEPLQLGFQVERESFETRRRRVDVEHAHVNVAIRPRSPAGQATEEISCCKPFAITARREKVVQLGLDLVRGANC